MMNLMRKPFWQVLQVVSKHCCCGFIVLLPARNQKHHSSDHFNSHPTTGKASTVPFSELCNSLCRAL